MFDYIERSSVIAVEVQSLQSICWYKWSLRTVHSCRHSIAFFSVRTCTSNKNIRLGGIVRDGRKKNSFLSSSFRLFLLFLLTGTKHNRKRRVFLKNRLGLKRFTISPLCKTAPQTKRWSSQARADVTMETVSRLFIHLQNRIFRRMDDGRVCYLSIFSSLMEEKKKGPGHRFCTNASGPLLGWIPPFFCVIYRRYANYGTEGRYKAQQVFPLRLARNGNLSPSISNKRGF